MGKKKNTGEKSDFPLHAEVCNYADLFSIDGRKKTKLVLWK